MGLTIHVLPHSSVLSDRLLAKGYQIAEYSYNGTGIALSHMRHCFRNWRHLSRIGSERYMPHWCCDTTCSTSSLLNEGSSLLFDLLTSPAVSPAEHESAVTGKSHRSVSFSHYLFALHKKEKHRISIYKNHRQFSAWRAAGAHVASYETVSC